MRVSFLFGNGVVFKNFICFEMFLFINVVVKSQLLIARKRLQ